MQKSMNKPTQNRLKRTSFIRPSKSLESTPRQIHAMVCSSAQRKPKVIANTNMFSRLSRFKIVLLLLLFYFKMLLLAYVHVNAYMSM